MPALAKWYLHKALTRASSSSFWNNPSRKHKRGGWSAQWPLLKFDVFRNNLTGASKTNELLGRDPADSLKNSFPEVGGKKEKCLILEKKPSRAQEINEPVGKSVVFLGISCRRRRRGFRTARWLFALENLKGGYFSKHITQGYPRSWKDRWKNSAPTPGFSKLYAKYIRAVFCAVSKES